MYSFSLALVFTRASGLINVTAYAFSTFAQHLCLPEPLSMKFIIHVSSHVSHVCVYILLYAVATRERAECVLRRAHQIVRERQAGCEQCDRRGEAKGGEGGARSERGQSRCEQRLVHQEGVITYIPIEVCDRCSLLRSKPVRTFRSIFHFALVLDS